MTHVNSDTQQDKTRHDTARHGPTLAAVFYPGHPRGSQEMPKRGSNGGQQEVGGKKARKTPVDPDGSAQIKVKVDGETINGRQLELSTLNAVYLNECHEMLAGIKAAENYAGIMTAEADRQNPILAPYDRAAAAASLKAHGKYICGENIFASSWFWTPTPMVPYNKAQRDLLMKHYFTDPAPLPFTTIVALPAKAGAEDIEKDRGEWHAASLLESV